MLTLDDDETDLALMAAEIAFGVLAAMDEPAKAVSAYCLPRLQSFVERIRQHQKDTAEEEADARLTE
jgi:hypothetical protein